MSPYVKRFGQLSGILISICLLLRYHDFNAIETVLKVSKRIKIFKSQEKPVICVLVLACNRPSVKRCLDSVFKHRNKTPSVDFPLIVSQDCGSHPETTAALESYGSRILHLRQPDQREIQSDGNTKVGYYKQTRHHAWALNHAFNELKCPNVIVLEDDLEVAPDFFEYFAATLPIYLEDPSIYCVTATNIQAKPGLINETAYELLYRTDMFLGWGWMLSKKVFKSLGEWPAVYWDVWMGLPNIRLKRSCIRPEIPRTRNFGTDGVSGHQFFNSLVRDLVVSEKFVPFTSMDLSYLKKEKYDAILANRIKRSYLLENYTALEEDLKAEKYARDASFRFVYHDSDEFVLLTTFFHLYGKTSNGMAHTVYNGVMTCMFHDHRIFLVPDGAWEGYDSKDDETHNSYWDKRYPYR